jgi:apolipoprotein N-acyltransferase
LAVIAGLLLAAAFPKPGIAGLAWVAPGLLLATALGRNRGEAFRIGYVGGLVFHLAALYWLVLIPYRWHGVPFGPIAGWLSLSAFLALYPATWVWLIVPVLPTQPTQRAQGDAELTSPLPRPAWIEQILPRRWTARVLWTLTGAAAWVGLEMIQARLFSGFPWNLLSASQYQMTPLLQVASFTGSYGVSFLIVWFSLALIAAGVMLLRRPTLRSVWIGELFLPVLAVAVVFNVGFREIRKESATPRSLDIVLIQPSIPQTLIWDSSRDDERFRGLIRLCEAALTNHVDLIIWPEAAVPKLLRYDGETFEAVTGLARRHNVWMIIGADDAEPRPNTAGKEANYFNSGFLISPEGRLVERYKKRSLVIFGEYVPLSRWLPFLRWFTPIEGGFASGDRPVPFRLPNLGVQTSVLICFEDVFPGLGREAAEDDTDFLVNLTNNGWFGESAAQWQHAANAVFRAVENGLPLVRCCNNGITCWVDGRGRVREIFRDSAGSVYGAGFLRTRVPLPAPDNRRAPTFYHEHGDWFGWSCVAVLAVLTGRRAAAWRGGMPRLKGGPPGRKNPPPATPAGSSSH